MDDNIRLLPRRVIAERTLKDGRINQVRMNLVHVLGEPALLDEALAAARNGTCVFDFIAMLAQNMVIHRIRSWLGFAAVRAYIEPGIILLVLGRHSC